MVRYSKYGYPREDLQTEKAIKDLKRKFDPAGDPDPEDLTIDNAYKTRWIYYHTILAILLLLTNINLIAILAVLAARL